MENNVYFIKYTGLMINFIPVFDIFCVIFQIIFLSLRNITDAND